MRIAYVDVNVRYINRTRDELLHALERAGQVLRVGPGYSDGDAVEQLRELLATPGAVDVIVTTPHIALASAFRDRPAGEIDALYRRSFAFDFPTGQFAQLARLNALLAKASIPRALLLLEADYYNFDEGRIHRFCAVADAILGFGPETWARTGALPNLAEEAFADRANDVWADFLESDGAKVSSMHHIIGDNEFCSVPLAARPVRWSVMGAGYRAREVATARLRAGGLVPTLTSPIRKMLAGLKKLRLLRGESSWSLDLVQRSFSKSLQNSRYSYTCGSGLEMPIRKFFEIPAAGAVLVCRPFRGAADLGFRAGENFVECEPQDILDAHRFLEQDPERAQAIADAGRRMVMEKHSVAARAAQLRLALDALVGGKGVGRWHRGVYAIQGADATGLIQ